MTTKLDRLAEEKFCSARGDYHGLEMAHAESFKKAIEEAKESVKQETSRTMNGYWCVTCRDHVGRKIVKHLESFTEEEK